MQHPCIIKLDKCIWMFSTCAVTDVEEAWRLRQAGLLRFKWRKAAPLFDRELHDECFSYPSNARSYSVLCEEDEDEWLAK